jgi:hypothetical protein
MSVASISTRAEIANVIRVVNAACERSDTTLDINASRAVLAEVQRLLRAGEPRPALKLARQWRDNALGELGERDG